MRVILILEKISYIQSCRRMGERALDFGVRGLELGEKAIRSGSAKEKTDLAGRSLPSSLSLTVRRGSGIVRGQERWCLWGMRRSVF